MNQNERGKKAQKKNVPHPQRDFKKPASLRPKNEYLLAVLILVCLATLLYLNSFRVPWHFDDRPNIVDNQSVHFNGLSLDRLAGLFKNSYSESIRFFSYFTFALNFYVGKLNVFGYHLVNLLIHIAAGIFLFWFILLTLHLPSQKERYASIGFKIAFLTSLIFIAHPIQTQSVTYIVQRMTSMAAMFYLLSLIFYIKGRVSTGRKRILYFSAMGLSGMMAFFSKENAFILPFFILLYEIFFFQEGKEGVFRPSMIKVLIILGGFVLMGLILLGGKYIDLIKEGYLYRDFTMSERVLTQFRVVLHYLTLLIFPHPSRFNLDYHFPVSRGLFDPVATFISLILILLFIGIGIWKIRKWPVLSFFIFWYFGNLVIESSIIPLEMVYEHRLYLPSIGPLFLFSLLLVRGWERWTPVEGRKREAIFWGLLILIVIPLSWSTIERNSIWRSELELWTDSVKKSPLKGRPHYNLGYYYYNNGQTERAVEEFELALKLDPNIAPAHFNLGVIDYNRGYYEAAARRFKKALALNPKYTQAYVYLGEVYHRIGKKEEGSAEFEKTLKMDPGNVRALNQLGMIYLRDGDLERAIQLFKRAVLMDPKGVDVRVNLAEAYVRKGLVDQALSEIQKAIALNPDHGEAYAVLGMIQLQKGMPDEAISAFLRALKNNPDDIIALTNLGVAYRYKGKIDEAITQFQKVLKVKPDDEEAHAFLGEAYLAKGKANDALIESEEALRINPRSAAARLSLGEIFFKQGKIDQAISEWKKVLEIHPNVGKAHHHLAAAYYAKKEFRLAIKHLDEASALGFKVHPQLAESLKPYR